MHWSVASEMMAQPGLRGESRGTRNKRANDQSAVNTSQTLPHSDAPPSMLMVAPVMYCAASLQRKHVRWETSSGAPRRLAGVSCSAFTMSSGGYWSVPDDKM